MKAQAFELAFCLTQETGTSPEIYLCTVDGRNAARAQLPTGMSQGRTVSDTCTLRNWRLKRFCNDAGRSLEITCGGSSPSCGAATNYYVGRNGIWTSHRTDKHLLVVSNTHTETPSGTQTATHTPRWLAWGTVTSPRRHPPEQWAQAHPHTPALHSPGETGLLNPPTYFKTAT